MDGKEKIIAKVVADQRNFYASYIATSDEPVQEWNRRVSIAREIIAAALLPNVHPTPCARRCKGPAGTRCSWSCKVCGGLGKISDKLCEDKSCPTCIPARMMTGYFEIMDLDLPREGRTRDRASVVMPAKQTLPVQPQPLGAVLAEPGTLYRSASGRFPAWAVLSYPLRERDHTAVLTTLNGTPSTRPVPMSGWSQVQAREMPTEVSQAYGRLMANNWKPLPFDFRELLP
jgi:hypothetical protein